MKFKKYPSPNFNERKNGAVPELIIIHYTGMRSLQEVLEKLSDPKEEVSCHYLIDKNGDLYQMVEEDKRAWHAGVSAWDGKDDINSRSIGIEILNNGSEPFTKEQLVTLAMLCKDLMHRHKIQPHNVIGHSDIAPDRKQDPGPHFPWKKMARHRIGHWPEPTLRDSFNAAATARNKKKVTQLLAKAGYPVTGFGKDKKPTYKELVTAFQNHFEPYTARKPDKAGRPTKETVAKLRALIRHKKKMS